MLTRMNETAAAFFAAKLRHETDPSGLLATVYGKRLLALGDNPRAAELAGVPVTATRISAFVISALAAVKSTVL